MFHAQPQPKVTKETRLVDNGAKVKRATFTAPGGRTQPASKAAGIGASTALSTRMGGDSTARMMRKNPGIDRSCKVTRKGGNPIPVPGTPEYARMIRARRLAAARREDFIPTLRGM